MKTRDLKVGKLYCARNETIDIWAGKSFKLKDTLKGDILLYIGNAKKIIHFNGQTLAPRMIYIFLDKDGETVWLERYELNELEETE